MIQALNQLKAIFEAFVERNLSGNEQLIMLHLFNLFNLAHWTEIIRVTDKSLLALLNQHDSTGKPLSLETLRRAKQRLKQMGLIDFSSGGGNRITEYKLVKLYKDPVETPDISPRSPPVVLLADNKVTINNSTEDVKTLDIKEKKRRTRTRCC